MYEVQVRVEGISPLLMNRFAEETAEEVIKRVLPNNSYELWKVSELNYKENNEYEISKLNDIYKNSLKSDNYDIQILMK